MFQIDPILLPYLAILLIVTGVSTHTLWEMHHEAKQKRELERRERQQMNALRKKYAL